KADVVMTSGYSESIAPANHTSDGTIAVLPGNGDGTFQGPALFATSPGGTGIVSAGSADFNSDGVPDLFLTEERDPNSSQIGTNLFLGIPGGSFQPPIFVASGAQEPLYTVSGDFNGDGKADLAMFNACDSPSTCNSPSVSISLGNGDG